MPWKFSEEAVTTLQTTITAAQVTPFTVSVSDGTRFNSDSTKTGGIKIINSSGQFEVFTYTTRSGNSITLTARAQESTTAQLWAIGDEIFAEVTKTAFANFVQKDEAASLTGAITFSAGATIPTGQELQANGSINMTTAGTVVAADTLSFAGVDKDGNYFTVSGATAINFIDTAAPSPLTLYFSGSPELRYNASGTGRIETPNGLAIDIVAGDTVTLALFGASVWRVIAISPATSSFVRVSNNGNADQAIGAGVTATLTLPTVDKDYNAEWSANVFTAKRAGVYAVSVKMRANSFSAGANYALFIEIDTGTGYTNFLETVPRNFGTTAVPVHAELTTHLEMAVGDKLRFRVTNNSAASFNVDSPRISTVASIVGPIR